MKRAVFFLILIFLLFPAPARAGSAANAGTKWCQCVRGILDVEGGNIGACIGIKNADDNTKTAGLPEPGKRGFVSTSFLLSLAGCSDPEGGKERVSSAKTVVTPGDKERAPSAKTDAAPNERAHDITSKTTGSLSFSVRWRRAPEAQKPSIPCSSAGINSIDATAYGPSSQKLASGGPWTCPDSIGALGGIPAGANIRLIVMGRNSSGEVVYRGERKGITVKAGQTTAVGNVATVPFTPSLQTPANEALFVTGFVDFTWAGVSGAASYRIQVSGSPGFASPAINVDTSSKSYKAGVALASRVYYWRVKATDPFNNAGEWSAPRSITVDADGPTNTTAKGFINNGAAATNAAVVNLDISAVKKNGVVAYHISEWATKPAADEPIWVKVPAADSFSVRVPYTLSNEDGKKTVYVRFKDALGRISAEQSDTIVLDTRPPRTKITSRPVDPTNLTSASFSFTSSKKASKFLCALDGAPSECINIKSYEGLAAGPHTFTVSAIDEAGNIDPRPAGFTWTIDTTPPRTTITNRPADPTNATSAGFSYSSTKPRSKFQCKLDNGIFTACSDTQTYTELVDGTHVLSVRATDAAGNIDPDPANYTWTIDTAPPRTTIASRPVDPTNSTSANFVFSSTKTGSKFQCKLDGGAYAACDGTQAYTGLVNGRHVLNVRATDALGNTEPAPASYVWNIDTTPPRTAITKRPADQTNANAASFSFTSTKEGSAFLCTLDGASTACINIKSYEGLAAGPHTFMVKAIDAVGNIDPAPPTCTWTVDVMPPVTTVTNKPYIWTNSATAGFEFLSSKKGSSYQCSLDGRGYSACTSAPTYTGLIDGSHTFSVRAIDAVGNVDPAPVNYTWTVDSAPFGTAITSQPPVLSHSAAAEFSFAARKDGTTFRCKLDKGSYSVCTSPVAYAGLAEENHTFFVKAIDAFGNEEPTPAQYAWAVDLPPVVKTPPGFINKGGAYITDKNTVKLSLAASSSKGVTGYLVSESSTTPELSSSDWITVSPVKEFSRNVAYTVKSGRGTKKMYVWFKDTAGNISEPKSDSIYLFNSGIVAVLFVLIQVFAIVGL